MDEKRGPLTGTWAQDDSGSDEDLILEGEEDDSGWTGDDISVVQAAHRQVAEYYERAKVAVAQEPGMGLTVETIELV